MELVVEFAGQLHGVRDRAYRYGGHRNPTRRVPVPNPRLVVPNPTYCPLAQQGNSRVGYIRDKVGSQPSRIASTSFRRCAPASNRQTTTTPLQQPSHREPPATWTSRASGQTNWLARTAWREQPGENSLERTASKEQPRKNSLERTASKEQPRKNSLARTAWLEQPG